MSRKGNREALSFELTPLIDVVFLLLIFFLVTSVFKKEELALLLNLPKASEGKSQQAQKKNITIELSAKGVALNGKEIKIEDLNSQLAPLAKDELINLRVDSGVVYKRLVKVLDLLQKNKLENISLITNKDK
jgi:biopolymer transport protein ExbD